MNLSQWTFRWKWGPMGETFSREGQPSICASGIAGISHGVLSNSFKTGSLLVQSKYFLRIFDPVYPGANAVTLLISSQCNFFREKLAPLNSSLLLSLPTAVWLLLLLL